MSVWRRLINESSVFSDPRTCGVSCEMPLKFVSSQKGKPLLILHGHLYNLVHEGLVCTWRCTHYRIIACGGRVHTDSRARTGKVLDESVHNHPPDFSGQNEAQPTLKNVHTAGAAAAAAATPKRPIRAIQQRAKPRPNSHLKRPSAVHRLQLPDKRTIGDNVELACKNRFNSEEGNKQKEQLREGIVESDFESIMIVQEDNLMEHLPGDTIQSDCTSIITVKEENMEDYTREDFFSDVNEQQPDNQILSNGLLSLTDQRIYSSGINIEEIQDEKQLRLIERREAIWQQRELHAKKMKIAEAEEEIVFLKLSSAKLLHNLELSAKA